MYFEGDESSEVLMTLSENVCFVVEINLDDSDIINFIKAMFIWMDFLFSSCNQPLTSFVIQMKCVPLKELSDPVSSIKALLVCVVDYLLVYLMVVHILMKSVTCQANISDDVTHLANRLCSTARFRLMKGLYPLKDCGDNSSSVIFRHHYPKDPIL